MSIFLKGSFDKSQKVSVVYLPENEFVYEFPNDAVNGHILYVDGGILEYIGKQPK